MNIVGRYKYIWQEREKSNERRLNVLHNIVITVMIIIELVL